MRNLNQKHRIYQLLAISGVFAFMGTVTPVFAEEEAISTDRPDFVESSNTVGKGRVQIETSVAFERDKLAGVRTTLRSTPTLFRFGVAEKLELRVETDGALSLRENGRTTSGTADTSLGAKWQFVEGDEKAGTPGMAALLHVDLASGSGIFRGDGTRPSLRWVTEWELPGEVGFGIMPGIFRDTGPRGKFTGLIMAATLSKGWTEQFRTFVEIAGRQITSNKNGGSFVTFDAGAAYQLSKDMQVDISFSRGLNERSPDSSVGVGLSIRY